MKDFELLYPLPEPEPCGPVNNTAPHSCEDYDGECMGWKGYHGNDRDWEATDFQAGRLTSWGYDLEGDLESLEDNDNTDALWDRR